MNFLSITFIAPLALAGLLAVGIPLYLHLRHKPRAIPIKFGAIQFLLKAQKKRRKRFKLEQILLLLLRCALVIFLAFIFAQLFREVILGATDKIGEKPLVIVMDDSISMMAQGESDTLFGEAMATARAILEKRQNAPTIVLPASEPDQWAEIRNASEIERKLSSLLVTGKKTTLDIAYAKALEVISNEKWEQARIQILSDGSLSAWAQVPPAPPKGVELVATQFMKDDFSNRGIASVKQIETPEGMDIEIELINGSLNADPFLVTIRGEQETIEHRIGVEPFTMVTHRFSIPSGQENALSISLPVDDFPLDNEVSFQPGSQGQPNILLVDGDTHPVVEESESFFLQSALSLQFGDHVQVITPAGLTAEMLDRADVVMFLNVNEPPALFEDLVQSGKGLFISVGDRFDSEAWNSVLKARGIEFWEDVVRSDSIQAPNMDHPILSGIPAQDWDLYLREFGVISRKLVSVGRSPFKVPLSYSDSSPALVAGPIESSRLVVWSTTVDIDATNIPIASGFIPLMRQIVNYLGFSDAKSQIFTRTIDELIDRGEQDFVTPRKIATPFEGFPVKGLKPGIYTHNNGQFEQLIHVFFSADEMNFEGLNQSRKTETAEALKAIGLKNQVRFDLGPSFLWWVLVLVLSETFFAAWMSWKWGNR